MPAGFVSKLRKSLTLTLVSMLIERPKSFPWKRESIDITSSTLSEPAERANIQPIRPFHGLKLNVTGKIWISCSQEMTTGELFRTVVSLSHEPVHFGRYIYWIRAGQSDQRNKR